MSISFSNCPWDLQPIGEVCEVLDRLRVPINSSERKNRPGPYPYYGANGQVGTIDEHIFDDDLVLVAEDGGFFFDPRPIAYRISGKCWVNNHAHVLKALQGLDTDWLLFCVAYQDISALVKGATRPKLNQRELRQMQIPVPSLSVQQRIVARIKECLGKVDEVEGHKKTLQEEYEELKYSTVSHVTGDLRNQHPLATIGELVAADKTAMRSGPFGSAMKHDEFVSEGNLVIGIANVHENRFDPIRKWMISDQKYEEMKRYEVAGGDVLITIMGTIGRTCVVPDNIGKAITSKHVYRIRLPKTINPHYISYVINYDPDARRQLYGTATGAVMPGLNSTKLRNLNFCVPPREIQDDAVEKLDRLHSILRERVELDSENDTAALRESILHQAFSGEL